MDTSAVVTRPTASDLRRRLPPAVLGMVGIGLGIALSIRADLGLAPWDVFHQGVAERTGLSLGVVIMSVGVAVMLAWIPLRQRAGLGTVINVLVIGPSLDLWLQILPETDVGAARASYLVGSCLTFGFAGGLYIGAALGPGPRDGLMTGLSARGFTVWKVRTVLELSVLLAGWLLGGSVGIGTVVIALSLGPITHVALGWFHIPIDEHIGEVLAE